MFRWNVETYPESWNVYDSFAEALAKSGDGNAAIFNYERSLELNPEDSNAVARLAKLREHQPG